MIVDFACGTKLPMIRELKAGDTFILARDTCSYVYLVVYDVPRTVIVNLSTMKVAGGTLLSSHMDFNTRVIKVTPVEVASGIVKFKESV